MLFFNLGICGKVEGVDVRLFSRSHSNDWKAQISFGGGADYPNADFRLKEALLITTNLLEMDSPIMEKARLELLRMKQRTHINSKHTHICTDL